MSTLPQRKPRTSATVTERRQVAAALGIAAVVFLIGLATGSWAYPGF